jgi:hypothetical protein
VSDRRTRHLELLIEPRQVEVSIREVVLERERPPVDVDCFELAPRIFQNERQVEEQIHVFAAAIQRRAIDFFRIVHAVGRV